MKVEEIISLLPEQELEFLAAETKVDWRSVGNENHFCAEIF